MPDSMLTLCLLLAFAAETRLETPSAEEASKAVADIRELYKDDYAKATRPEAKAALATKILADAIATRDAPTERYVMFRIARDLALQAGDLGLVNRCVTAICDHYQVDDADVRVEAVEKLAVSVSLTGLRSLVDQAVALSEELADVEAHEASARAANAAVAAARRTKDVALLKKVTAAKDLLAKAAAAYVEVKAANAKLETAPTDAEANLTVGKYYCLLKADWVRGLPALALGGDSTLAKLAQQDLAAENAAAKLAAADAWYDSAEQATGEEKSGQRRRAHELYVANSSGLTGIAARKVATRIEAISKELAPAPAPPKKHVVGVLKSFPGHHGAAFSPDNRSFLTADDKGVLHLWNLSDLRELRTFEGHAGRVNGVTFSPEGAQIFSLGKDKTARVWETATSREKKKVSVERVADTACYLPDIKRWYTWGGPTLFVLDPDTGKLVKEWNLREGERDVYVRPPKGDGRYVLVSGITDNVRIFDLATGKHLLFNGRINTYGGSLTPDGRLAATCGGGDVRLWAISDKAELLGEYKGSGGHVYGVDLTRDGRRLLSVSTDHRARVWDAKSREVLHTYDVQGVYNAVQIRGDGRYAFAQAHNGNIQLLGMPE